MNIFASFILITLFLFSNGVIAQSHYKFDQTFSCVSISSTTSKLAVQSNYTQQVGPVYPEPCHGGTYFCGFSTNLTIPNTTVLQCILNRIKQEADARKAANTMPWLQHGTSFTVTCDLNTYTITTYLYTDFPAPRLLKL